MNKYVLLLLGFLLCATTAIAQDGPILLAQGEGDYDESFDSHGADVDEIMEIDSNLTPRDTTAEKPAEPAAPAAPAATAAPPLKAEAMTAALTKGITWLGQSGFLVQDARVVYFDPFRLGEGLPKADLVFITHDHYDHLSPQDLAKITGPATTVIGIAAVRPKLPKEAKFIQIKAGDTLTVDEIGIEVVPAYNIGKQYHPKDKGYVGYVVTIGGRRIYHAGDTDLIPEMKDIKADLVLLPVGGKFTMDAAEAAKAADLIRPKLAIPMHYGAVVGSEADAQTFKKLSEVPVVIMQAEPNGPATRVPAGSYIKQGDKRNDGRSEVEGR
jgi:L-ascorbate metabolism protein UlaG (beta-lactamase superfamily)